MDDCKDYLQPFYYPEEAVRDWCEIPHDKYEEYINRSSQPLFLGQQTWPDEKVVGAEFPCYPKRLKILKHALDVGELPMGRDGRPVAEGDHVAPHRRTITPEDLKAWMEAKFPNERPAFLFNHLERRELLDRKKLLEENEKLLIQVQELNERLERGRMLYREKSRELERLTEALRNVPSDTAYSLRGAALASRNEERRAEKAENMLKVFALAVALYQKNPALTRNALAERISNETGIPVHTVNKYWSELETLPHAEKLLPPKKRKG